MLVSLAVVIQSGILLAPALTNVPITMTASLPPPLLAVPALEFRLLIVLFLDGFLQL
jgi:hypothetical protein